MMKHKDLIDELHSQGNQHPLDAELIYFSIAADAIEQLEQQNTKLVNTVSEYEKFMANNVCYTTGELLEEEHRRIIKLAYELKSAFPHHTGVYHWMIGYADELLQNKQAGSE